MYCCVNSGHEAFAIQRCYWHSVSETSFRLCCYQIPWGGALKNDAIYFRLSSISLNVMGSNALSGVLLLEWDLSIKQSSRCLNTAEKLFRQERNSLYKLWTGPLAWSYRLVGSRWSPVQIKVNLLMNTTWFMLPGQSSIHLCAPIAIRGCMNLYINLTCGTLSRDFRNSECSMSNYYYSLARFIKEDRSLIPDNRWSKRTQRNRSRVIMMIIM